MEVEQLTALLETAANEVYDLSRGLWPVDQDETDVRASLASLAHQSAGSRLAPVTFRTEGPCTTCSCAQAAQLYRIAQEAVGNAHKHAGAAAIAMRLDCRVRGAAVLTVRDDGTGRPPADQPATGLGLRLMAHRARMAGGTFRIEDGTPCGTVVSCSVPCPGTAVA
jgi:two-component system CheB/CheR fusion protein